MKSHDKKNRLIYKIEDFSINLFFCSVWALSIFLVLTIGIKILVFLFHLIHKEIYELIIQNNF